MTRVIGIDPGLSGAICMLSAPWTKLGTEALVVDLPVREKEGAGKIRNEIDAAVLKHVLCELMGSSGAQAVRFILERVSTMPGRPFDKAGEFGHDRSAPQQSGAGAFSLGDTVGCIRGVVGALGYEITWVTPIRWKRYWGIAGKEDQKSLARLRATELYPGLADTFKRVKDHGRAEALLIARWGWDQEIHR